MCGIFGVVAQENAGFNARSLEQALRSLFLLSESRGKEAAGVAIVNASTVNVLKRPIPASELIKTADYNFTILSPIKSFFKSNGAKQNSSIALIGHSRLVTNGSEDDHNNNQPVIAGGMVAVHNGIVVNDSELWSKFPSLKRHYEVDTEIVLALLREFYSQGVSLEQAVQMTFEQIQGAASVAVFFEDLNALMLATNNGSLYYCMNKSENAFVFASERKILSDALATKALQQVFPQGEPVQLESGQGMILDLSTLALSEFSLAAKSALVSSARLAVNGAVQSTSTYSQTARQIVDTPPTVSVSGGIGSNRPQRFSSNSGAGHFPPSIITEFEKHIVACETAISRLRRCTHCTLPETFPFILFDANGVCNFCKYHNRIELKGAAALRKLAEGFRRPGKLPDCIVSLSGGRDSTYGLHYVKTKLGLNPITYTYDWGMVTDLARRNISRICGKLGVEHILISADIRRKRENIRKNVSAWLAKPDLGLIPLFMAGDKQYFYHGERLRKEMGVELTVLSENLLEKTNFKSGFSGIKPMLGKEETYSLPKKDKLALAMYYARGFLLNPRYINSSLLDSFLAYCSYYVIEHNFLSLYRYIQWDEDVISRTLREEYDWELASDTTSTWRIGDGTASFYNYIYYAVCGFTENDTFRSNQIREGLITRDEALITSARDNRPRWESIKWYCDTVGIDAVAAVRRINQIRKLYSPDL